MTSMTEMNQAVDATTSSCDMIILRHSAATKKNSKRRAPNLQGRTPRFCANGTSTIRRRTAAGPSNSK